MGLLFPLYTSSGLCFVGSPATCIKFAGDILSRGLMSASYGLLPTLDLSLVEERADWEF
ncbi:hypothetical protein BDP55DRAFT_668424 [Colletotrichum godetiae]|uniref:Uncharacterized protein n=1 Tax=Colletotrichum godetiae TaxID=1209918 RepID=A0AAJ0EU20_9PEZI|nr:uncharacterized protein BDP55DRAFT_668424 [Colletotrichum godetiae]KAK1673883.1 hypothetical protein BDP55DRAFT_668424 [Colletotrichum godetiae]